MTTPEIPKALHAAVNEFNQTAEMKYEQSCERFHQIRNRILAKKGKWNPPNYGVILYTPKAKFEKDGKEYDLWMEEETYAENGGSNEQVTLKLKLSDFASAPVTHIFRWSNSMDIQTPGMLTPQHVTSYKKVDELIEIMEFLESKLPDQEPQPAA